METTKIVSNASDLVAKCDECEAHMEGVNARDSCEACQERVVTEYVKQRLSQTNILRYCQIVGSGGMGSIRQELITLLTIARFMNVTLVLQEFAAETQPLQIVWNVPFMRYKQLTTFGATFVWQRELIINKTLVLANNEHCKRQVQIPFRPNLTSRLEDLPPLVLKANHDVVKQLAVNDGQCIHAMTIDGTTGWTLDSSQCHTNKDCVALFNSFHLHPVIRQEVNGFKPALANLLHGESYSCFHMNSMLCDAHGSGTPSWVSCMTLMLSRSLQNVAFLSRIRNVFIAGQSDTATIDIVRNMFSKLDPPMTWLKFFTLANLSVAAHGGAQGWFDMNYIKRSGFSFGLCSPGFARSYVGEYWSSFTMQLLMNGLINENLLGSWTMLAYGDRTPDHLGFANG